MSQFGTLINTNSGSAIADDSRYKDTAVYAVMDFIGQSDPRLALPHYALFEPPTEFLTPDSTWLQYRVGDEDIGFLDRLADRFYDDATLWWVLALANGIIDIESGMPSGTLLLVPPRTLVDSYIQRDGKAQ